MTFFLIKFSNKQKSMFHCKLDIEYNVTIKSENFVFI
jgi:hypothetical protein